MDKFFVKFPTITYNGQSALDLSRRVTIVNNTAASPNLFYPVENDAGLRPDVLADAYYQDAEQSWIVYLSNGIVDPYYQWYLNETEFEAFIISKYGEFE